MQFKTHTHTNASRSMTELFISRRVSGMSRMRDLVFNNFHFNADSFSSGSLAAPLSVVSLPPRGTYSVFYFFCVYSVCG